jgi:hypothetical protein
MNIPYSEVDKVAKLVPMVAKITLKSALDMSPKLKMYDTRPEIKELIDIAQKLGISDSVYARCRYCHSPEPLTISCRFSSRPTKRR